MNGHVLRTLLRAWLAIAVIDGVFATLLPTVATIGRGLGPMDGVVRVRPLGNAT